MFYVSNVKHTFAIHGLLPHHETRSDNLTRVKYHLNMNTSRIKKTGDRSLSLGTQQTHIIVNADDYCYFDCISRGILDSARNGIVTATGILANTEYFDEHIAWLQDCESLDLGVHLNLTDREPLTHVMQKRLVRWGGQFPEKYTIAKAVISGALKAEDIKAEWQAQIERCLEKKLSLRFLNSHEHIHMLPILFPVVQALAKEYGIPHIRFPTPEPLKSGGSGALIRNTLLKILGTFNRHYLTNPAVRFFGMGMSGRLNMAYLKEKLPKLKPGHVYELMCHPGYYDANEICNPRLLSYHDWEGELNTLTSPTLKELCHTYGIRLIGYKNVKLEKGQLIVVTEES